MVKTNFDVYQTMISREIFLDILPKERISGENDICRQDLTYGKIQDKVKIQTRWIAT